MGSKGKIDLSKEDVVKNIIFKNPVYPCYTPEVRVKDRWFRKRRFVLLRTGESMPLDKFRIIYKNRFIVRGRNVRNFTQGIYRLIIWYESGKVVTQKGTYNEMLSLLKKLDQDKIFSRCPY